MEGKTIKISFLMHCGSKRKKKSIGVKRFFTFDRWQLPFMNFCVDLKYDCDVRELCHKSQYI